MRSGKRRAVPPRLGVYTDDPVSSVADDLFSRAEYAERIAQVARELAAQVDSATIALVGPPGSGKTSTLNFIKARVDETNSFKVVAFNPWIANDLSSLVVDFFKTLRSTMPGARSRKLRRRIGRYAKKTAPVLGMVSVGGLRVNAEAVVELFSGDSPLATLRDNLMNALGDLDVPILVTIDDIDRLQADEVILIAKLLRLAGRLPNVYYFVCFDEKNLVSKVSAVLPGDNAVQRARVYLEKVVQVKFDMPPLDELSAYRFFSKVLDAMLARHGITMHDIERERLLFFYRELLAQGLREPVQIRRFCSFIEPALVLVGSDLDIVDYVAVSYLRFAYPRLADDLSHSETRLTLGDRTSERRHDINWCQQLTEAGVPSDDLGRVGSALWCLFPSIGPQLRTISPRPPSFPAPANGASSPIHFRRYFHPNTPRVPVDAHLLENALREVLDDQPRYMWNMMSFYDLEQAVPMLRQHTPPDTPSADKILRALNQLAPYTSFRVGDIPAVMPNLHAWMMELATLVEPDDPTGFLRSITNSTE